VEGSFVELDPSELSAWLDGAAIVVNCLGVLQDGGGDRTEEVHHAFVARLLTAMPALSLLVHFSIPGRETEDETAFSLSKRRAEQLIARSGHPHVILRPGFVVAPVAYGGSALIRGLAALPLDLPTAEAARPFAVTAMDDITRTVAQLATRWQEGERDWAAHWDVLERNPGTVSDVVTGFRHRFGGPRPWLRLPRLLMAAGAWAGDLVARLGWRPPIRSTALHEMRRGVEGDPAPWIAATGIEPASLEIMLRRLPASVQERWFGRLYLAKALVLASLAIFWCVSGLNALILAFQPATAILTSHGIPEGLARWMTLLTSLGDIGIGLLIAVRRLSRFGLIAGILMSLGYWAGATLLAPELWTEPLGALVKTGPAIVLMLVAIAISDDR
jgi:uncharacterized protein YbjT (DUF2867 family)